MKLILIILLLVTFIIDIFLTYFFITRKDNSRSMYFTMLALALTAYALGSMFLELSETHNAAINSLIIVNIGFPLIAPYFLFVTLSLFQPKYLRPWMAPASIIYGSAVFLCVMFNDVHRQYYTSVAFATVNGHHAEIRVGLLYWIQHGISFMCIIAVYIILFLGFIKRDVRFRSQMFYILTGVSITFISDILINFTGMFLDVLSVFPFILTIVMTLFYINLSKYQLLDIALIASNTAVEIMSDAMIIVDNGWGFLFCNGSAKALFPSLNSFSEGEPITQISEWPSELASVVVPCEEAFVRMTENDKCTTYRANVNKIMHRNSSVGWYIIIHDMTDITFLINQLEDLATTDSMTKILNRRSFLERVQRELDMSARLNLPNALIIFDIDAFKDINDTYGHVAGDHVLCAVVDIVKNQLRSYDILARYGGDEFVIFTTATEEDSLYKFVSRVCKAVENAKIIYDGLPICITLSFGAVQIYPGDTFDEAMLAVDAALYEAKHNGKNQVVIGLMPRKNREDKEDKDNKDNNKDSRESLNNK